ncbi:Uncharacterised protein [Nocardia farcinica]|uniref:Permease n=1 Tax=Nocardia farcinica TaxID=37329 RepID=A0A449G9I9_NOCFR|nr:permease [Nocardia farcinica]VFA95192.1 Uncharacterised protein [Nocardia farcinica]
MTSREVRPEARAAPGSRWRVRVIGGLILLAVLVIAYFILAAYVPRAWAQRLGHMVDGSFAKGIGWGLTFGLVCTLVPLLLLLFAVGIWRKRGGRFLAGVAAVLAVLVAVPNLMTLTIVWGGNNAAHAGERILDVEAPAFRGATLVGAIIAALLFCGLLFLVTRRQWRRRQLAKQQRLPGTPPPVMPQTTEAGEPAPRRDM